MYIKENYVVQSYKKYKLKLLANVNVVGKASANFTSTNLSELHQQHSNKTLWFVIPSCISVVPAARFMEL